MKVVALRSLSSSFKPQPGSLLSPALDVLLAGGISVVLYVWLITYGGFLAGEAIIWGWAVYYLAFFVNYPHFAASYQLMYQDLGKYFVIRDEHRMFSYRLWWAGVIVPIILIGFFLWTLAIGSAELMGYLVNGMFFFVGWHYVKQIFGCVVVLSAVKKLYYSKLERYAILATLYLLWATSYINGNTYYGEFNFFGVPYSSLGIPSYFLDISLVLLLISLGVLAVVMVRRFLKTSTIPPLAAVVAYASIFLWLHPFFAHPEYFLIVPFFHSLQYLLFVSAYKKNQSVQSVLGEEYDMSPTKQDGQVVTFLSVVLLVLPVLVIVIAMYQQYTQSIESLLITHFSNFPFITPDTLLVSLLLTVGLILSMGLTWLRGKKMAFSRVFNFMLQIFVLGILLFSLVPTVLDMLAQNGKLPNFLTYDTQIFGFTLYLFFFTIFVNIHHYFVDNVIWRRDNPNVRQYLFS